ncbi:MAG: hypothetical protein RLZZ544_1377 [Actinomycetota bacterium]|jgi:hypothetical protein
MFPNSSCAVPVDAPALECHSLAGFENEVRRLFSDTFVLGNPIGSPVALFDHYAELNLGWYLTVGAADCVVVTSSGRVVAYGLLCAEPRDLDRWTMRRVPSLCGRVLSRLITFRLTKDAVRFYSGRFLDAVTIGFARRSLPVDCAHVHMNVSAGHRTGQVALILRDELDKVCRDRGISHWMGEINSVSGHRRDALARCVGNVVGTKRNRTMSRLMGVEVTRLTVVRTVPRSA